jgi:aspartate aminotransferase
MVDKKEHHPEVGETPNYSDSPKIKNRYSSPEVYLNLNVRGLPQSATLTINELSRFMEENGKTVYKMGLGQSPFPVPKPVVESLKENAHQKDYLPVKGLPALRKAVAAFHQRKEGIPFHEDNVLIGPGSKELMFIVQLVYYGDLVIPTPSWVSYAPQAQIIGRHIRWVPTRLSNNLNLTPDELEKLCEQDPNRPRILILNYPNNPSGSTYTTEELKTLAKIARKYRIILISDEIYGELHHKGQHVSIARFYPEGTIISSGLSKWCGAGGWRLGTFTFPDTLNWLRDAMAVVASETFTATSAPIQYAAVTAFQGGKEIDTYLANSRKILSALGRYCAKKLQKIGATLPEPKGGFYLFVNFSAFRDALYRKGILTSNDMCKRLLKETGVAVLPGNVFGRQNDEFSARLAYVDFDGEKALQAAEKWPNGKSFDQQFLTENCGKVVKAIDLMCDWFNSL